MHDTSISFNKGTSLSCLHSKKECINPKKWVLAAVIVGSIALIAIGVTALLMAHHVIPSVPLDKIHLLTNLGDGTLGTVTGLGVVALGLSSLLFNKHKKEKDEELSSEVVNQLYRGDAIEHNEHLETLEGKKRVEDQMEMIRQVYE